VDSRGRVAEVSNDPRDQGPERVAKGCGMAFAMAIMAFILIMAALLCIALAKWVWR